MSTGEEQLTGLAAAVDLRQVNALLLARATQILDPAHEDHDLALETIRGVATEVAPIVGQNPSPGPRRDLAVWAITVGSAAQLEASLFPEQQGPGDLGRAAFLGQRYRDLLAQLRGTPEQTGDDQGPVRPRGRFREARPYPDPAEVCW